MSTTLPYGFNPQNLTHDPKEQLRGMVADSTGAVKKASDIEERAARAIAKLKEWGFVFRQRLAPASIGGWLEDKFTNLPGELEIDILAYRGSYVIPIQIDGEIGHFKATWQRVVDDEKTAKIDQLGEKYGWQKVVRIKFDKLATQEMADRALKEVLL